jgi:hypothetical protein
MATWALDWHGGWGAQSHGLMRSMHGEKVEREAASGPHSEDFK